MIGISQRPRDPRHPMSSVPLLACAVAAALGALIGGAGPARADSIIDGTRVDVVVDEADAGHSVGRVVAVDLEPGDAAGQAAVVVSQELAESADVEINLSDVAELEHMCLEPELEQDANCAADTVGELGSQLRLSVTRAQMESDDCVLEDGERALPGFEAVTIDQLAGAAWTTFELERGTSACLVLAWWLPSFTDNNVVMTDEVRFTVNVGAEQKVEGGEQPPPGTGPGDQDTGVLGTKFETDRAQVEGRRFDSLAHTGTNALGGLVFGLALVSAGVVLVRRARRQDGGGRP